MSDTSYEELHRFAAALGVPRHRFQGDHYDVPSPLREAAIAAGARPVSSRELLTRLRAAGLRKGRRARLGVELEGEPRDPARLPTTGPESGTAPPTAR